MRPATIIRLLLLPAFCVLLLVSAPGGSLASPGQTFRVSVDTAGQEGNGESGGSVRSAISADGRYVAFDSAASNLVPDDTNSAADIFVHDRNTGETTRVSVDSAGGEADGPSQSPAISADGRYVAFASYATNLVPEDTNGRPDIFVHDRNTGETTRVSVDSAGNQANDPSANVVNGPAISGDGRYVAFFSYASNLVPEDTNGRPDIFVHDRNTGETTRVSVDSAGSQANSGSESPAISGDGRYVAFQSAASNLVPNDTNGKQDIFVHDRDTGETTRVSVDSAGAEANGSSNVPAISADGLYVAFASAASNLVPTDTNGKQDIFVHDRETSETTRVSVNSAGEEANGASYLWPAISADGRFAAFTSTASNLVSGDTNNAKDIFVHDRETGETTRVSVDSAGTEGNANSPDSLTGPVISGEGRYVVFQSSASNLVPGDLNGKGDIFVHDRDLPFLPPTDTPTPTLTPTPTDTPTPGPTPTRAPIGGIAELSPLKPPPAASDSWSPDTVGLAAVAAGGVLLLAAGGWYARRRRRAG